MPIILTDWPLYISKVSPSSTLVTKTLLGKITLVCLYPPVWTIFFKSFCQSHPKIEARIRPGMKTVGIPKVIKIFRCSEFIRLTLFIYQKQHLIKFSLSNFIYASIKYSVIVQELTKVCHFEATK